MSQNEKTPAEFAEGDFLGARIWRQDGLLHIDVTHLVAPEPFVATLRLLEWPGVDDEIVFINNREPLHLFPELIERGWSYRAEPGSPDVYRMRMTRGARS